MGLTLNEVALQKPCEAQSRGVRRKSHECNTRRKSFCNFVNNGAKIMMNLRLLVSRGRNRAPKRRQNAPVCTCRSYATQPRAAEGFWSRLSSSLGLNTEPETETTSVAPTKSLFEVGRPPTATKQITELCDQAAEAQKSGQLLLAKVILSKALLDAPGEEAWYLLCRRAEVHLAMDRVAFALDDARKAALLMPKRKEPFLMLARVMVALDQHGKARFMNIKAEKYGARKHELVKIDEAKAEVIDPHDELTELVRWRTGKIKLQVQDWITKLSTDPEYFEYILRDTPLEVKMIDEHTYLRGLVAKDNIPRGTIMLLEEPILTATFDRDRCSHCSKPLDLAKVCRCPQCDQERYCSEDCAKEAAEREHEKICGYPVKTLQMRLANHPSDYMDASTVMMYKLIGYIRSTPHFPCDPNSIREFQYAYMTLHSEPHPPHLLTPPVRHMMSLWSTRYLRSRISTIQNNFARWEVLQKSMQLSTNRYFDYEWYERMLGKVLCNALPVRSSDDKYRKYGGSTIALYRAASFINHSCVPNAYPLTQPEKAGARVAIIAITPIKRGEQIFIPYVHPQTPVEKRRQYLLQRYGFFCNCPLCVSEGGSSQQARVSANTPNPS